MHTEADFPGCQPCARCGVTREQWAESMGMIACVPLAAVERGDTGSLANDGPAAVARLENAVAEASIRGPASIQDGGLTISDDRTPAKIEVNIPAYLAGLTREKRQRVLEEIGEKVCLECGASGNEPHELHCWSCGR